MKLFLFIHFFRFYRHFFNYERKLVASDGEGVGLKSLLIVVSLEYLSTQIWVCVVVFNNKCCPAFFFN